MNPDITFTACTLARNVLFIVPGHLQRVFDDTLTDAEMYAHGWLRLDQVNVDSIFEAVSQVAKTNNARAVAAAYTALHSVMTVFEDKPESSLLEAIISAISTHAINNKELKQVLGGFDLMLSSTNAGYTR